MLLPKCITGSCSCRGSWGERTVNMSKSSRKLNKKKEKAAKVDTHRRGAGLREQMKEQMEAGDYAEALGSLAELIKDNSYDPDLLYDGAYCYFMVGDYERAVRWVDMVMDLAPYHIPARILLARLCILNEREESALAMSDALLAGSRDMLTEDQAQDLNDILEYYYRCEPERIRSEYPHVAEFVAGCPEENIPVFEELPGTAAAGRNRAAWEEVAMEEPVTEEATEMPPQTAPVEEAPQIAEPDIEGALEAIAAKPLPLKSKIHLYNVFAGGYFYQKSYEAARSFLSEAMKIDPLDEESLRNMAVLCHELGEKEKAQEFAAKLPQADFLLLSALR